MLLQRTLAVQLGEERSAYLTAACYVLAYAAAAALFLAGLCQVCCVQTYLRLCLHLTQLSDICSACMCS